MVQTAGEPSFKATAHLLDDGIRLRVTAKLVQSHDPESINHGTRLPTRNLHKLLSTCQCCQGVFVSTHTILSCAQSCNECAVVGFQTDGFLKLL